MTPAELLPLLAPPLLGAVIGYVTNAVAIRMLFRPLRPWRVLGVRLPLTPGIIPARRGELAARIGRLVGHHLLTGEDVGRALAQPAFRRELAAAVNERLGHWLDRDLGAPATLLPAALRERLQPALDRLGPWLAAELAAWLASPAGSAQAMGWLEAWGERDLRSLLSPEREQALRGWLDERLAALLHSEALAETAGTLVDRKLDELLQSERSLRQLLPEGVAATLAEALERELPALLQHFSGMLHDPEFRQRLTARLKQGIEAALDSLEGMTAVMAALLDWDAVHGRIPDFLDRAGEELARWLQQEETRRKVAELLRGRLDGWLDTPVCRFAEQLPFERVVGLRRFARERTVALLHSPRTLAACRQLAGSTFDRLQDRPFRHLAAALLPDAAAGPLTERTVAAVRAWLCTPAGEQTLTALCHGAATSWLDRPVGRLASRLPADLRAELEQQLLAQLTGLLRAEVPPLVEALGVERMVEEKVNALDVLQVEELLLAIMREQFTWINLFGALLGGLIGGLNLLLLQLT